MYRKQLVFACLKALRSQWAHIPFERACEKLEDLGAIHDSFVWLLDEETSPDSKRPLSAYKLKEILTPGEWNACDISPIQFVGGPKKRLSFRKGSLLTLLIDRILIQIEKEGLSGVDILLSDPEIYC